MAGKQYERKIAFYDLVCTENQKAVKFDAIKLLDNLKSASDNDYTLLQFFGLKTLVLDSLTKIGSIEWRGRLMFVLRDEYQGAFDTKTGIGRDLSQGAPPTEGVVEITHFILIQNGDEVFVGVESVQSGPKSHHLADVLGIIMRRADDNFTGTVSAFFKIGKPALDQLKSFKEAGKIVLRVKGSEVDTIIEKATEIDGLADSLISARRIARGDYIEITIGYSLSSKHEESIGESLIDLTTKLLSLDSKNNLLKSFTTARIYGREEENTTLTPLDLLKERMSLIIFAQRTEGKLKYFVKEQVHNGIRNKIRENFNI
jgi:hypothetical protein